MKSGEKGGYVILVIRVSIICIIIGLILTVPFSFIIPMESASVQISFIGLHAIMVQGF
jgi:hypothetical protein